MSSIRAAVGLTEAPLTAEPELSMATNEVEVAASASKCAFSFIFMSHENK